MGSRKIGSKSSGSARKASQISSSDLRDILESKNTRERDRYAARITLEERNS